jgi:NitT/TauT family transport system substrate-binding protein
MFEPVPTLCAGTKTCEVVIDLTAGNFGPKVITAMNGAMITMLMRRDMVESNPKLVHAYNAAMSDATKWARDPANFEEVLKIYEPIINFGSAPNAAEMRRSLLKTELASGSPGMETSRAALKAIVEFALANKTIPATIDIAKLVWKEAP